LHAARLATGFLVGLSAFNNTKYGNNKMATLALVDAGAGAAADLV